MLITDQSVSVANIIGMFIFVSSVAYAQWPSFLTLHLKLNVSYHHIFADPSMTLTLAHTALNVTNYYLLVTYQCHAERSLERNRKIARRRMQEKLDDHYNGENSIRAIEKRMGREKREKKKAKTRKKLERLAEEKQLAIDKLARDFHEDGDADDKIDDSHLEQNLGMRIRKRNCTIQASHVSL